MHRLASCVVLLISLATGCGSAPPAASPPPSATPLAAPPPAAPLDCGTVDSTTTAQPANARTAYQCFVDAVAAGDRATVRWHTVTDEGGRIYMTYRTVPGAAATAIEITTDDRDDGFSGSPGIHTTRCRSIRIEPTTSNSVVLYPVDCV